jgi:hypothetical protein
VFNDKQFSLLCRDLAELKNNAEFLRQQSARNDALSARADEIEREKEELAEQRRVVNDLMVKACALLDRVTKHISDAEKFAEPIALPPDTSDEEEPGGELTVKPAKEEPQLDDTDGDEGPNVLPRAPVPAVTPPGEPVIGLDPKKASDPTEWED